MATVYRAAWAMATPSNIEYTVYNTKTGNINSSASLYVIIGYMITLIVTMHQVDRDLGNPVLSCIS